MISYESNTLAFLNQILELGRFSDMLVSSLYFSSSSLSSIFLNFGGCHNLHDFCVVAVVLLGLTKYQTKLIYMLHIIHSFLFYFLIIISIRPI